MTQVKLKYLDKRKKKSGGLKWFFRHPLVDRTRLPGQPGEAAFQHAYAPLLAWVEGKIEAEKQLEDKGSIRWLVDEYKRSNWWSSLSVVSQKSYVRELDRLCKMVGDLPFSRLTSKGVWNLREQVMSDVAASREKALADRKVRDEALTAKLDARDAKHRANGKPVRPRAKLKRKPPKVSDGARTADLFKATLSAMMSWAQEAKLVDLSPVERLRRLRRKGNVEEHIGWTEYQIEFALNHAPRRIRDGVVIGLYVGQRLGDCCKIRLGQCIGPIVQLRQSKTGSHLNIIATGPLIDLIARRRGANCPDDPQQLLLQDDGQPYSERLFSEHLRNWLDEQGWEDLSFHGLRYAAGGTLNEAGATVATIISILGHRTYQMALKYLAQREEAKRAAVLMQQASDRRDSAETKS